MASRNRKKPVFASTKSKKDFWSQKQHLFKDKKKNFRTGNDIQIRKKDLTRFVRWPRYVRVQRQRAVLLRRLKVPPSINQFTDTLNKNQATELFSLLSRYRPETRKQKKERLYKAAQASAAGGAEKTTKPKVIKFGLKHVTELVESRKAKLVVIAHDVDPIELVVWLPQLCKHFDVPYCIVKGKARLGQFVGQKTATAVALTEVNKEHVAALNSLTDSFRTLYNEREWSGARSWGGGIMGAKTQKKVDKAKKLAEAEAAKKLVV